MAGSAYKLVAEDFSNVWAEPSRGADFSPGETVTAYASDRWPGFIALATLARADRWRNSAPGMKVVELSYDDADLTIPMFSGQIAGVGSASIFITQASYPGKAAAKIADLLDNHGQLWLRQAFVVGEVTP